MCVVSNIGDNWKNTFPQRWPEFPDIGTPVVPGGGGGYKLTPEISRHEFDALKREVEELKKLLLAAKKFDEATGQKDCHMDEKVEFIKKIAEFVGVDVEEVFKK